MSSRDGVPSVTQPSLSLPLSEAKELERCRRAARFSCRRLSSRRGALRSLIIWTDSRNSVNRLSRPLGDDWNSPLVRLARDIQQDILNLGVTARVNWSPRLGPLLALAHIEATAAIESPEQNTQLPDILLDCLRQSSAMFSSDPRVRPIQ